MSHLLLQLKGFEDRKTQASMRCHINFGCHVCRQFFEGKYTALQQTVFARNRQLFPEGQFAYSAFLWAVGNVRARVHAPLEGDSIALVPMADLVRPNSLARAVREALSGCIDLAENGPTDYGHRALVADGNQQLKYALALWHCPHSLVLKS